MSNDWPQFEHGDPELGKGNLGEDGSEPLECNEQYPFGARKFRFPGERYGQSTPPQGVQRR